MLPAAAQIPAFRLVVGSLLAAGLLRWLPISWTPAATALILCGLTLGAVLCLWQRKTLVAYLCAVLGVGVHFVASWQHQLPVRLVSLVPPFPAGVEGRIVEVLRVQPPVVRCIVEGTLDAQPLPPLRTRLLLTVSGVHGTEPWIGVGKHIRATVRLRPPWRAQLPTDFPEWSYCAQLGVQWVGAAPASALSVWSVQEGWRERLLNVIAHHRAVVRRWIEELYPASTRSLALALLLGDRSELIPQQKREFALSGVSHVLAISGLHVGIIAGMVVIVVGFLRWGWLRWVLFTLAVTLFVLLTGAQPSALRAGVMASLGFGMYLLGRLPHPVNIVAAVALALLLIDPGLAFSPSFQLSVLATLGIVVLFEPCSAWLQQHFPHLPRSAAQLLALTLAATWTSAPVGAAGFGVFSLLSVPLNLIAVPLSNIALVAGLLGLCTYPLVPAIGALYSSAAHGCLEALQRVTAFAAALPFAAVEGEVRAVVAASGASVGLLWLLQTQGWKQALARAVTVGVATLLGYALLVPEPTAKVLPRAHFVAALLPRERGSMLVVLVDRFARAKPRRDPALEAYLVSFPGELQIAYTGYSSELLAVRCRRLRSQPTTAFPAPAPLLAYIQRQLPSDVPLSATIRPRELRSLSGH